jgi:Uma2 family endonuclease
MDNTQHWTIQDLEPIPEDNNRYEIMDGELYVSNQLDVHHWNHQIVCTTIVTSLVYWNEQTGKGSAIYSPGVIFSNDNAVVPDVVWISNELLATATHPDGKLHSCPELVVEVLSPGSENARRDRELKLKLYSRRNAQEYWIVNWQERTLEVYRREDADLRLVKTLNENNGLETPLLPGFSCKVGNFFTNTLRGKL